MSSFATLRRSARLQGIAPTIIDLPTKRIRKEVIQEAPVADLKEELKEKEKPADGAEGGDTRLHEWKHSMKTFLQEQADANQERLERERRARNPLAFELNVTPVETGGRVTVSICPLDKGGILCQYAMKTTDNFVHGKTYHKFNVSAIATQTCDCSDSHYNKNIDIYFNELPDAALALPWLKPWSIMTTCPIRQSNVEVKFRVNAMDTTMYDQTVSDNWFPLP